MANKLIQRLSSRLKFMVKKESNMNVETSFTNEAMHVQPLKYQRSQSLNRNKDTSKPSNVNKTPNDSSPVVSPPMMTRSISNSPALKRLNVMSPPTIKDMTMKTSASSKVRILPNRYC